VYRELERVKLKNLYSLEVVARERLVKTLAGKSLAGAVVFGNCGD
jgi:hypothetical protein